jgi:hypothetical protein
MIWHYVALRLKHLAHATRNTENVLIAALIVVIVLVYALMISTLLNKTAAGEVDAAGYEQVFRYALLIIVLLTLGRAILPAYVPQRQFFPKHYPVSLLRRYLVALLRDFLGTYFFYLVLAIVLIATGIHQQSVYFLFTALMALIASHLLRRLLQYGIDYPLKREGYAVLTVTLLVVVMLVWQQAGASYIHPLMALALPAVLFVGGLLLEASVTGAVRNHTINIPFRGRLYLKLLFHNGKARSLLIMAFVFKVMLLAADIFHIHTEGTPMTESSIILWMVASPVILFTYVFNNAWAFWPGLLDILLRSEPRFRALAYLQLRLLLLPLLADMVLTFSVLWVTWGNPFLVTAYYFGATVPLAALALYWSMTRPKSIQSTFQLKGTSSILASFISMVLLLALTLLRVSPWFYLMIPLYIGIGIAVYHHSKSIYPTRKYSLMQFWR